MVTRVCIVLIGLVWLNGCFSQWLVLICCWHLFILTSKFNLFVLLPLLILMFSCFVIHRIDLAKPDQPNQIELGRKDDSKVYRLFLDPTGEKKRKCSIRIIFYMLLLNVYAGILILFGLKVPIETAAEYLYIFHTLHGLTCICCFFCCCLWLYIVLFSQVLWKNKRQEDEWRESNLFSLMSLQNTFNHST